MRRQPSCAEQEIGGRPLEPVPRIMGRGRGPGHRDHHQSARTWTSHRRPGARRDRRRPIPRRPAWRRRRGSAATAGAASVRTCTTHAWSRTPSARRPARCCATSRWSAPTPMSSAAAAVAILTSTRTPRSSPVCPDLDLSLAPGCSPRSQHDPALSGGLSPAPASPGPGFPQLQSGRCDGPMAKASHLHTTTRRFTRTAIIRYASRRATGSDQLTRRRVPPLGSAANVLVRRGDTVLGTHTATPAPLGSPLLPAAAVRGSSSR